MKNWFNGIRQVAIIQSTNFLDRRLTRLPKIFLEKRRRPVMVVQAINQL
jgi:hypothetical protein